MPRPRKWRNVCSLPDSNRFGPLDRTNDDDNYVTMTVDEYETIRLIDLEGMTQEDCSAQMNVARTTVQGIYNNARRKLADCLVNGKALWIDGGEYKLCPGNKTGCRRNRCCRHNRCVNSDVIEDQDSKKTEVDDTDK